MIDILIKALLEDMHREAVLANALVASHESRAIEEDPYLSRALAMSFTIIGEGAAQMPDDFRLANPQIAWSQAKALRNRIAHAYRTVVPALLIDTARSDLPNLIADIDRILAEGGRAQ
jgi:uncharacterized protein with HEPN domain